MEQFTLPSIICEVMCPSYTKLNGNSNNKSYDTKSAMTVSFGDAVLQFLDTIVASETCEELFTPDAPHIRLALSGAEMFTNGSGSHHQLRKLNTRLDLISSATKKAGGVYLYANQKGCDGNRMYFDGCSSVMVNGELVAQGSQFSLDDVEVVVATVDLDDVSTMRGRVGAFQQSSASHGSYPSVSIPIRLSMASDSSAECAAMISRVIEPKYALPEEEIAYGPACWMWDYLRRSGASGFLLPLSGGADSASTAAIVGAMCQMVAAAVRDKNIDVVEDVERITGVCDWGIESSCPIFVEEFGRKLAHYLLTTVYMGTVNSSVETKQRAARIASDVGALHLETQIDVITSAFVTLISSLLTIPKPKFKAHGGSYGENIALQNIQARSRMVLAFFLAQLLPWTYFRGSFMLVLGSANVDEGLRGYMTKYDCSSADINPIGGISKLDLRSFLSWAATHLHFPSLADVVTATPTAELEPLEDGAIAQTDEDDMGMTYAELGIFGRLRTIARCGPVAMFKHLLHEWTHMSPMVIANKVQHFFRSYSINRHKMTTVTPSYHAESYSPDDNR